MLLKPGTDRRSHVVLMGHPARMGHLLDALSRGYDALGFAAATGGDEVFKALVLARIIEPTSKLDSLRVLAEAGMDPPSYRTLKRRLRLYAGADEHGDAGGDAGVASAGGRWRAQLARACAAHVGLGPATSLLYDVTTLYFETDQGDGFREPGFSKERRLEPQITVGLLGALRADPRLLSQLGRAILDGNFEPSLHEDICAAAGLDLEMIELADLRHRHRRDPAFREQVMVAYEYQCAFCGYDGWLGGTAVGLDAAHVRWWAFDGPDDVTNGICLCALHHKLLDKGVLGMTGDRTVNVSAHYVGRGPTAREQVHALAGRPVTAPQNAFPDLDDTHIAWHTREVFRAPARTT